MNSRWLLVVCVFVTLFAGSQSKWKRRHAPSAYAPPREMLDDVDQRPRNRDEENAITELKQRSQRRATADKLAEPTCDFANWTCPSCCLTLNFLGAPKTFCAEVELNLRRLKIRAALTFQNGDADPFPLFEQEFCFSKFCIGFPALPKIGICGHIYYFDTNFGSPFYLETCLTIIIADLVELRFYCIRLLDGTLSRTDEIEPEEKGLFAVAFKTDRVVFEFNSSIPELLWEILKKLGDFIKFITDAIVVAVKALATKVWNAITNFFSPGSAIW